MRGSVIGVEPGGDPVAERRPQVKGLLALPVDLPGPIQGSSWEARN